MKESQISLVLTALLVTSLFQTHHHISAASENNSDEGSNGCFGFQCLVIPDEEADLFMNQWARGSSRILFDATKEVTPSAAPIAGKQVAVNCKGNYGQKIAACLGNGGQYGSCDPTNRDPYCPRRSHL